LWGHAFLNPRDIPFMVFFLGAISSGLALSDIFNTPNSNPVGAKEPREHSNSIWKKMILEDLNNGLQKNQAFIKLLLGCSILLFVILVSRLLNPIVEVVFKNIFLSNKDNLVTTWFLQFAQNAKSIPIESYINKAIAIINSIGTFLILFLVLCTVVVSFIFSGFQGNT